MRFREFAKYYRVHKDIDNPHDCYLQFTQSIIDITSQSRPELYKHLEYIRDLYNSILFNGVWNALLKDKIIEPQHLFCAAIGYSNYVEQIAPQHQDNDLLMCIFANFTWRLLCMFKVCFHNQDELLKSAEFKRKRVKKDLNTIRVVKRMCNSKNLRA